MDFKGGMNDETIQCTNLFTVAPGGTMNVTLKQGDNVSNLFKKMGLQENYLDHQGSDTSSITSDKDSDVSEDLKKTSLDDEIDGEDCNENDENRMREMKQGLKAIADIQLSSTSQLETLIFILKQYVKMGEETEYIETRQKINIITSKTTDITNILQLAAQYFKTGKEFEMILTCSQAVSWYKQQAMNGNDPQTCIKQMVEECMSHSLDASKQMFEETDEESKPLRDLVPSMMYEMLFDVKDITEGVSEAYKVGMTTLAAYYIACMHFFLQEWAEMFQICNGAIIEMKSICRENAKKCLAFGDVLFMAAMAKYRLHDYRQAELLFRETIEVFEAEGNINNNAERERNVRLVNQWLTLVLS